MPQQYYALFLSDPAAASFCSFDKLYIGTMPDITLVMKRMQESDRYEQTVAAFQSYAQGNLDVTHNVAFREVKLLEPVKLLHESTMALGEHRWTHLNAWQWPYEMRFSKAEVHQILVQHKGEYRRCIRAGMTNLCYLGIDDDWKELRDRFWGHAELMETEDLDGGGYNVTNLLYVEEDSFSSMEQAKSCMDCLENIKFDQICDEIFADG